MRIGITWLTLLVTHGLALAAHAEQFTQDTTSHTFTPVSGYSGDVETGLFTANQGLQHMYFMEITDDPKEIHIDGRGLVSVDAPTEGGTRIELKVDKGAGNGTQVLSVGDNTYFTAIQVCTNDKKDTFDNKLKGVKAWGATLDRTGKLQALPTPVKFERPNCAAWRSKVSCPAGTVATGVKAHSQFAGKGFSGLALRCSKIKPR